MKNYVLCFGILLLATASIIAQSNVVAAGGNATGDNGSVSYSVGQIDFRTQTGIGGIITEGLQQPYEITIISGIDETEISLDAIVFPNPATDIIQLNLEKMPDAVYDYILLDINGKVLERKGPLDPITQINMDLYASGTYFLQVRRAQHPGKTFKVNKIR